MGTIRVELPRLFFQVHNRQIDIWLHDIMIGVGSCYHRVILLDPTAMIKTRRSWRARPKVKLFFWCDSNHRHTLTVADDRSTELIKDWMLRNGEKKVVDFAWHIEFSEDDAARAAASAVGLEPA